MPRIISAILLVIPFLKLVWRLVLDRRVPFRLKSLPLIALAYVLSPLDLMPDILPVLGQIDDLLVAAVLLLAFVFKVPSGLVNEYLARTGQRSKAKGKRNDSEGPTIEGRYRYVDAD
ncbi:MAG: DUF1232 domain-containing protein [Dehalococcoidia bacterium]